MAAITRQDLLRRCTLLKAHLEQEDKIDIRLVQDLRQKFNEPPPFSADPTLHKTYAAYQKIISELIAIYQQINGLVEQHIAFIDHVIDQMQTSEQVIDIREPLTTFRTHLDPLKVQGLQLQRKLQVNHAKICLMTHKAEMNAPIERVQNVHEEMPMLYPYGLRRRIIHQLGTSLGSAS